MDLNDREQYLINMLIICHTAMTEDDAHVGLFDSQWRELKEITGIDKPRTYDFKTPENY